MFYHLIVILFSLYNALILPYLPCCNILWANTYPSKLNMIFKLQKKAVYICTTSYYLSHLGPLFYKFKILIINIHKLQTGILRFSHFNNLLPPKISQVFCLNNQIHSHYTHDSSNVHLQKVCCIRSQNPVCYSCPILWNSLKPDLKSYSFLSTFKRMFKKGLVNLYEI